MCVSRTISNLFDHLKRGHISLNFISLAGAQLEAINTVLGKIFLHRQRPLCANLLREIVGDETGFGSKHRSNLLLIDGSFQHLHLAWTLKLLIGNELAFRGPGVFSQIEAGTIGMSNTFNPTLK